MNYTHIIGDAVALAGILFAIHYFEGWIAFIIGLLILYALIYIHQIKSRLARKQLWIKIYVRRDSLLQQLLSGGLISRVIALVSSVILSAFLYIALKSYSTQEMAIIYLTTVAGLIIYETLLHISKNHLTSIYSEVIVTHYSKIAAVVLSLFIFISYKTIRDFDVNLKDQDIVEEAEVIKKQVHHVFRPIELTLRSSRYIEFRLLKFRDEIGFPFGWIAYIFFLTPNTIALYSSFAVALAVHHVNEKLFITAQGT